MNLHYSQTEELNNRYRNEFFYHMNLHYSQTKENEEDADYRFSTI